MAASVVTWRRLGLLAAVAGSALMAGTAYAHAEYVRSIPGAGAVIATAPVQVDIWFSQDLFRRAGENGIVVTGPNGQEYQTGDVVIDDDDRRHLTVALGGDLPAGEYAVTWFNLSSEDGDDHEGSFTFTLDPQAQVTSTPMSAPATATALPATATAPPAAEASPTPAADSQTGCALGLLPAAGMVFAAVGARRRRRP